MGLLPGAASSEQVVFDTKIPDLLSLRSLEVVGERENRRARGRHFFQSPKIFSSGLAVACTYVEGGFVVVVCLFVCFWWGACCTDVKRQNDGGGARTTS